MAQIPAATKKLLERQGFECALCGIDLQGQPPKNSCLDHDHRSGHIRAVLCRNCNGIEGKIFNLANRGKRSRSVSDFLERVLAYWAKHANPVNPIYHPKHKTGDEKRLDRNKKARMARIKAKALQNVKTR